MSRGVEAIPTGRVRCHTGSVGLQGTFTVVVAEARRCQRRGTVQTLIFERAARVAQLTLWCVGDGTFRPG